MESRVSYPFPVTQKALGFPAKMGALGQLWAGTMPEPLEHNGEYVIPWAKIGKTRKEAYDPEVGRKLREYLEKETKG